MSINCCCVSPFSWHPQVLHFKSMAQKCILSRSLCVCVSQVSSSSFLKKIAIVWFPEDHKVWVVWLFCVFFFFFKAFFRDWGTEDLGVPLQTGFVSFLCCLVSPSHRRHCSVSCITRCLSSSAGSSKAPNAMQPAGQPLSWEVRTANAEDGTAASVCKKLMSSVGFLLF